MVSSVLGSQPMEVAIPVVADAVTLVGLYRPSTIQQWIWLSAECVIQGSTYIDVMGVQVVGDVGIDTGPRLESL